MLISRVWIRNPRKTSVGVAVASAACIRFLETGGIGRSQLPSRSEFELLSTANHEMMAIAQIYHSDVPHIPHTSILTILHVIH